MSSAPKTSRATKTTKATAATTTTTPVVAVPVVAAPAPVVAAPVVTATEATTTAAVEQVDVAREFTSLVETVNTLRATLATVFSNMKKLEKQIPRELKKAAKGRRRRTAVVEGGEAKPKKETVFTKPTPISDALCTFLTLPKGSSLSRSEVTTRVCRYARDNKLMAGQVIKADASLRKLLGLTEAQELKILNLQSFLKTHYLKPAVAPTPA
jgi:hypothetical protein